tara:strand:- start:18607 stop:19128 length:522 start_codon:yes stop_codon:yes gene_type:complete
MLEQIAQILFNSAGKPVNIMKNKLNGAIRAGNSRPQTTTGKTANSITANVPQIIGGILNWAFKSNDAAVRLNNGGSLKTKGSSDVPYSGKGGGGESAYIGALITWARKKYGLDEASAKRMAFAVAGAAKDRGRTVKSFGWLDNAKAQIEKQINDDMAAAIALVVNQKINKALK